jgi:Ca2+-binding RTX toxin-like protein
MGLNTSSDDVRLTGFLGGVQVGTRTVKLDSSGLFSVNFNSALFDRIELQAISGAFFSFRSIDFTSVLGGNDTLNGEQGDDFLSGEYGTDVLNGGDGLDTLTGGSGGDRFLFNTPSEGIDTITDFTPASDTIVLSASGFSLPVGSLPANAFRSGSEVVSADSATQRLLYNTATGSLYFDSDGIGANPAVELAQLTNLAALTSSDFAIV